MTKVGDKFTDKVFEEKLTVTKVGEETIKLENEEKTADVSIVSAFLDKLVALGTWIVEAPKKKRKRRKKKKDDK